MPASPKDDPELPPSFQHTSPEHTGKNTRAIPRSQREYERVSRGPGRAPSPSAETQRRPSPSALSSEHAGPHSRSCQKHDAAASHAPSSTTKTSSSPASSCTTHRITPSTLPSGLAVPSRTLFDPWNSSSTGHQRAENRLSGSTSWRQSRHLKLGEQYRGGPGGGKRVADAVGAGSENFGKDGRKENWGWLRRSKGLRTGRQKSLLEAWASTKPFEDAKEAPKDVDEIKVLETDIGDEKDGIGEDGGRQPQLKQIFDGLVFYLNGSTAPLVSDHKLKFLVAERGGSFSIALGRRSVTHVIVGRTSCKGGCGVGLAASKIQKEVAQTRGNAIKFVTAEWVLSSIKASTRQPESRFANLNPPLAPPGQTSVYPLFTQPQPPQQNQADG
ncbi:hypothetical protein EJ04DRAFT_448139 [Polyplosphaeria fusca]|uniref:BRCT domain-containing protein n=1 Tax=Polyplosphaeria fusca TaxID=682080 RepID=A0A9P4QQD8_9PLEO|nr:hypothetical protein EJ04DRAFT_448139 [Polyplosphaeria fusca]